MNLTAKSSGSVLFALFITISGCTGYGETEWTPDPSEPRAFVSMLGADTLTIEVFTRTDTSIVGVLVERTPYTHRIDYSATLNAEGTIASFTATKSTPPENPNGPEPVNWSVNFSDGEATLERTGGQNPGMVTMEAASGDIPSFGRSSTSMYVYEQMARQLLDSDGEAPVRLIGPTSTQPRVYGAKVLSADSVAMDFFGSPRVGWLGANQQLLGVSGAATTMKSETRRVRRLDVDEFASRWALMDVDGTGIGVPSPSATYSETVDGANFEVLYSQPAKRGRNIWGGLVPEGEVWRTGANAAVHFTTDRDLAFEGLDLPAGTYSLFSIHSDESLQLIINSQTGQWGTQYDESQDLGRIAMIKESLDEVVERFTIQVVDTEEGAELSFVWDRTRFSAPFRVR